MNLTKEFKQTTLNRKNDKLCIFIVLLCAVIAVSSFISSLFIDSKKNRRFSETIERIKWTKKI